ncbi:hypothetical protein [uncultured Jatrophihabitans sp.]|uniref:hypothetical protein n=1 Tax=uncultured Jatrophihabitans sp. TaxID=1610747 RepID=UPI0035CA4CEA
MPLLFTEDLIASMRQRFSALPEPLRPSIWHHAVHPLHADMRAWLEGHLASLDDNVRDQFLSRLRSEQLYTQALAEIATAHVVTQPGYAVEYGPEIDGLTPDLRVTDPCGRPLLVEVWRRGVPQASTRRNNGWAQLARAVQRIPVPLAIAVDLSDRPSAQPQAVIDPPDDAARRTLVAVLRDWLTSRTDSDSGMLVVDHLRFRVVGTTTSGRTELLPVTDGVSARREDVVHAIEAKVKKYRRIAERYDLPLLIVLSADDGTALNVRQVEDILAGQNSITMTIPQWGLGVIDSGPIKMRQSDAPPKFNAALSGIGWLDIRDGVHAQIEMIWQNPAAARPVEPLP